MAKVANIRLRENAVPVVASGKGSVGHTDTILRFPTEKRQRAGWQSAEAKEITRAFPHLYELITTKNCNCK